ncbi:ATP-binding protein [Leyella stercorea]|uniref:ATP-binding protein n=1 Tax=Leyella stercorea TaxID=363265 RepID=UPI001A41262C|nr:ATP-binding protein [Leyella stercorea]MBL6516962.1 ATP-binding protein [Leyella stercorea]
MERSIYSSLKKWKESPTRKPLILQGARQVGKTYILKEFGAREYSEVVYINCDDNNDMQNMFVDYDVDRIIRSMSAISGISIKPSTTLLILDEIQEVERGLASLKYFCEKAPEYHVAVAGSLLGITLHEGTSFPVGKVDMLYMYPMDFEEFLLAMGKEQLVELLRNNSWEALTPLRGMLTELLRQYYFVGGMPEAVKTYVERGDIWEVRSIHSKIIDAYRNDMSKHVPKQQVQRINMVWNSIPSQLARDNKKFIYGALRKGARANDFEIAIQWLVDSGLVHKVHRISKPVVPLKFYEDIASFKLFLLDCGLLGALSETPPEQILIGDNVFEEYKGAFTENYVLQQLKSLPRTFVYYYSNDNSTLEIDFVVQHEAHVIPIEVKAEENLRAKSLRQFVTDNAGLHGVRFSMSDYREQDWLTNVPLWAVRWAF